MQKGSVSLMHCSAACYILQTGWEASQENYTISLARLMFQIVILWLKYTVHELPSQNTFQKLALHKIEQQGIVTPIEA